MEATLKKKKRVNVDYDLPKKIRLEAKSLLRFYSTSFFLACPKMSTVWSLHASKPTGVVGYVL